MAGKVEEPAINSAAAAFMGRHDFHGFTDDDAEEKSTLVEVARVAVATRGDAIHIIVEGSHFLWKMVRRMVGVLVEVGRGEMTAASVPKLMKAPGGIPAKLTAPASGLFLARVLYPGDTPGPVPLPPLTL